MLRKLGGVGGVVGILAMLVGIALVAEANLQIAAGIALVIAGVGLLARGLIKSVLAAMGMGGLF